MTGFPMSAPVVHAVTPGILSMCLAQVGGVIGRQLGTAQHRHRLR